MGGRAIPARWHLRGPGILRAVRAWAIVGALAALTALLLTLLPTAPLLPSGSSGVGVAAAIPPWNNWTCNPNNLSPTALSMPTTSPNQTYAKGTVVSASYEFKVVGYSTADLGATLYFPQAKAVFPLTVGPSLVVFVAARNLSVGGPNWSSSALLTGRTTLNASTSFASGVHAYLSTSKMAVMVNRSSGTITVEFAWHWQITKPSHGGVVTGPWSVPSRKFTNPYLPSIFYPAPLLTVLSTTTSPAPSGTQFNMTTSGWVNATSFRVVLEYPNNGTEIQSVWQNSSQHATTYVATVPLAFRNGTGVPSGSYIIHIHDVCEAIVKILSVTVTAGVPGPGGSPAGSAAVLRIRAGP